MPIRPKKMIALLLAGGQGSRLGILTESVAKPAIPFGGKYRIIDFVLSNCSNSDIDTVGVLTQYQPLELNSYIGNGQPWDLDRNTGGVFVLPPYVKGNSGEWYSGTANAIYQNIGFIDQYSPSHVLILSGDHIYKMDYSLMLKFHEAKGADVTIAVIKVPKEETSRYGIMETDRKSKILDFVEKPISSKSDLASMGIYIFKWKVLKQYLIKDSANKYSSNDFGKDVIPLMLQDGMQMYAYSFDGYWRDVGTVESLWQANMDLLPPSIFNLEDIDWRIYSRNPIMPPHFITSTASVSRCLVTEGAVIAGNVSHSIIFYGVIIEEGASVVDSIIMPGATIHKNARVVKSIIGECATIGSGSVVGDPLLSAPPEDVLLTGDICVIGDETCLPPGVKIAQGMILSKRMDLATILDQRGGAYV